MQQFEKTNTNKKGKESHDGKLNNLFYCHELGCCEVFHGKKSFENYLINVSSEDKVRKTFIARKKSISLPKSLRGCSIDTINVRKVSQ